MTSSPSARAASIMVSSSAARPALTSKLRVAWVRCRAQPDRRATMIISAYAASAPRTVRPVVRRVVATVLGDHLAQRHELVGVGVHARWVGQPAAQPDRSVDQTLPDHLGHPSPLGGRRGPVVVAHHQHPHGALRHQVRRVAGDPAVQRVQVVGHPRPAERRRPDHRSSPASCRRSTGTVDLVHRGVGESVLAEHLAGDALAHLGEMIMVDQDLRRRSGRAGR